SGALFGTQSVSAADNGTLVTITFNAAAINAIMAAGGGTWALGGSLSTLGGATNEFMFGFTGTGTPVRTLVLTGPALVPEPGTFGLMSLGLLICGAAWLTGNRLGRRQS